LINTSEGFKPKGVKAVDRDDERSQAIPTLVVLNH
jgi:hypothetical protein